MVISTVEKIIQERGWGWGRLQFTGALVTVGRPHLSPVTWVAREGSEVYTDGSIQITCSIWREEWIPG